MYPYIISFIVEILEDYTLNDKELHDVLNVNDKSNIFKIIHNIRSLYIIGIWINKQVFLNNLDTHVDCVVFTETKIIDDLDLW